MQPSPDRPSDAQLRSRLQAVAQLLRRTPHLNTDAQRELAGLLDELSRAVPEHPVPTGEVADLTERTEHLVRTLHEQENAPSLGHARGGLEQAIVNAEEKAPLAANLARQFLEALANLGI